ncbi:MAG: hypothetical protein HQK54_13375 [Oligoflexales bacterium]|nr:hypothetical protein [Oligoflexales bacterium]
MFLIGLTIILTFFEYDKISKNNPKMVAVGEVLAISAAISELRFGFAGFTGVNKILDSITDYSINSIDKGLNSKIYNSSKIEISPTDERHVVFGDVGLISFFKLAFIIWGYSLDSVVKLFFCVFIFSLVIYILTYFNEIEKIELLLFFLVSHLIILMTTDIVGIELQLNSYRYYPVLAIIPALHISLEIWEGRNLEKYSIIPLVFQMVFLVFIIHVRSSTIYILPALLCILLVRFFDSLMKKEKFGPVNFSRIITFSLVVFFLTATKLFVNGNLHSSYQHMLTSHHFWLSAFTGLSINPDANSKYGMPYFSDPYCYELVKKRAEKDGYRFDIGDTISHAKNTNFEEKKELRFHSKKFESYMKDEYISIFKKDPWFVIKAYLVKLPEYFKVYYSFRGDPTIFNYLGAGSLFFHPYVLTFLLLYYIFYLPRNYSVKKYIFMLLILFSFSLGPPVFLVPMSFLLADSGLFLTAILFYVISSFLEQSKLLNLSRKRLDP